MNGSLNKILETLVYYTAYTMEIVGIAIIVASGVKALYYFVKGKMRFHNHLVSLTMAEGMNMSLGLLAAELSLSIVTKTIPNLIVLGGIAAIRVGLTFVLHWEIGEYENELIQKLILKSVRDSCKSTAPAPISF